jgi:hypothetical protein
MSQCRLCQKNMLKKRFLTKFWLLVDKNHTNANFFTCRECRRYVEIMGILPHQTTLIYVLKMEESDGSGILTHPLKTPENSRKRKECDTSPGNLQPLPKLYSFKESLCHTHDHQLKSKEIIPEESHKRITILSPKPQRIIPRSTLLSLMSSGC